MRKKLIYLVLLGTTTCAYQAHGADAALKYLQGNGTPPSLAPRNCSAACNENVCVADLNAKNYRCFMGCSQHTGVAQIMSCANRQFISFINDLHAQLNVLNQQFNVQEQELRNLVAQLADAVAKIVAQKAKLGGGRAQNADLQQRFDNLEAKFNADQQRLAGLVALNQQLHDRLADANANINQRVVDIAGLNAQIVANQNEIVGLKVELDEGVGALEELIRQFNVFVKGVSDITGLFRNHSQGIRQANLQLKEQINAMEKFIREHDNEVIPFIQEKENEFNEMLQGVQEDLNVLQGFLNGCKAEVDKAKSVLEQASRGAERVQ